MSRRIQLGIVGAGAISASHAQAIHNHPAAHLSAVCDIDDRKVKQLAEQYNVRHRFTSLEDMLKMESLDAVTICLPSSLHHQAAIAIASAGKHIFCEKPLDIHLEHIDLMIDAAHKHRVKLGCAYQRRTMPQAKFVHRIISEGKLGKLIQGDAYLKYYRPPSYYERDAWRGTWQTDGGGALMNQGIHGIDLIQWLMGGVHSLSAQTATLLHQIEVEDTAIITVQYNNGALGVIQGATSIFPGQSTRFELHGSNGTIIFDDQRISICELRNEQIDLSQLNEQIEMMNASGRITQYGHRQLIADFVQAICDDREPLINGEEARKAVAIITAAYRSARMGQQVTISST